MNWVLLSYFDLSLFSIFIFYSKYLLLCNKQQNYSFEKKYKLTQGKKQSPRFVKFDHPEESA